MQLQKEVGVKNSSLVDNAINVNDEVENNLPLVADSNNSDIVEVEEKQQAETIILGEGKTLRLLALELFGDKVFWVYIYQENIDVISNPNKVNYGLELKIPDINEYFIDNNDPESIYKAKLEGFRVLEEEQKI